MKKHTASIAPFSCIIIVLGTLLGNTLSGVPPFAKFFPLYSGAIKARNISSTTLKCANSIQLPPALAGSLAVLGDTIVGTTLGGIICPVFTYNVLMQKDELFWHPYVYLSSMAVGTAAGGGTTFAVSSLARLTAAYLRKHGKPETKAFIRTLNTLGSKTSRDGKFVAGALSIALLGASFIHFITDRPPRDQLGSDTVITIGANSFLIASALLTPQRAFKACSFSLRSARLIGKKLFQ